MWNYGKEWGNVHSHLQPMVKADADEFNYDGTTPKVKFTCNIPDYELIDLTEPAIDKNASKHSLPMIAKFKGARDFTANVKYNYIIHKGKQKITWEQDFPELHIGDSVTLSATASSGLDIKFKAYDDDAVKIEKKNGTTIMTCLKAVATTLIAEQPGNDNWEPADKVVKRIDIMDCPSGVINIENDITGVIGIYDINGKKTKHPQKGVKLIRYKDGKVRKVILKP